MSHLCALTINYRFANLLFVIWAFTSILEAQEKVPKSFTSENKILSLDYSFEYELEENEYLISQIKDSEYTGYENYGLVICSNQWPGMVIYDFKGKELRQIGSFGKGPFEYKTPELVKFSNKNIYVWDSKQLKLSVFSLEGKPLLEVQDFRWAVNDFTITGDTVFFFRSGKYTEDYIQGYDLSQNNYIQERYGGPVNETFRFLMMLENSGGVNIFENRLIYVPPHKTGYYQIDLSNRKKVLKETSDSEFKVPEISNAFEIIKKGVKEIEKYYAASSFVFDLFKLRDYVVIASKVAGGKYNSNKGFYDYSNQKIKFYFFSNKGKYIDEIQIPVFIAGKILDGHWGAYQNSFYILNRENYFNNKADTTLENQPIKVYWWKVQELNK